MKLAELLQPRNVNQDAAGIIVGQAKLFLLMVQAGWIKPVIDQHKCKLFATGHIQGCCDLLELGYLPSVKNPTKAVLESALAGAMRPAYTRA